MGVAKWTPFSVLFCFCELKKKRGKMGVNFGEFIRTELRIHFSRHSLQKVWAHALILTGSTNKSVQIEHIKCAGYSMLSSSLSSSLDSVTATFRKGEGGEGEMGDKMLILLLLLEIRRGRMGESILLRWNCGSGDDEREEGDDKSEEGDDESEEGENERLLAISRGNMGAKGRRAGGALCSGDCCVGCGLEGWAVVVAATGGRSRGGDGGWGGTTIVVDVVVVAMARGGRGEGGSANMELEV